MKHGASTLLIQGIRETVNGKALFGQELLRRALEQTHVDGTDRVRPKLSERERQVLSSIFDGLTNKEIGARLNISETAVKACLQQLFAKTGVRTGSQLVRVALEQYRDQL